MCCHCWKTKHFGKRLWQESPTLLLLPFGKSMKSHTKTIWSGGILLIQFSTVLICLCRGGLSGGFFPKKKPRWISQPCSTAIRPTLSACLLVYSEKASQSYWEQS